MPVKIGQKKANLPPGRRQKLKEEMLAYLKNCSYGLQKTDFFRQFPILNDYSGLYARIMREFLQTGKVHSTVGAGSKRFDSFYFYRDMSPNLSFLPYDAVLKLLANAEAAHPGYNWHPLKAHLELLSVELLQPRFKQHRKHQIAVDMTQCEVGSYLIGVDGLEHAQECPECGNAGVLRMLGENPFIMVHCAVWKQEGWETLSYCSLQGPSLKARPITQEVNEIQ